MKSKKKLCGHSDCVNPVYLARKSEAEAPTLKTALNVNTVMCGLKEPAGFDLWTPVSV